MAIYEANQISLTELSATILALHEDYCSTVSKLTNTDTDEVKKRIKERTEFFYKELQAKLRPQTT